jgi:hypothetical protein
MRVNILGTIIGLLGVGLIFLGVTGRYKVFVGGGSGSSSSSAGPTGSPSPVLPPNPSAVQLPGVQPGIFNQPPVPTLSPGPAQQQSVLQGIEQGLRSAFPFL